MRERAEFEQDLPTGAVESGWLGADGASEDEIAAAEKRLGVTLPLEYRAFLETTNGFGPVGLSIRRLRSAAELKWLRDEDPELVEIWAEEGDQRLGDTLVVSDSYDDSWMLLNPGVRRADGEWQAWFFADWVPGAHEYESFRELLEDTFRGMVDHLKAERGEPTPQVAPSLGVEAEDLEGLVQALQRPAWEERQQALSALASLRDQRAAPAVAAVLRNAEEHPSVRQTAARVLGQLRHAESVNALMDVLRLPWPQGRDGDPEPWSDAQEAVRGLKQAATQGLLATPLSDLSRVALAAAVGDPNADLRAEAGWILCYARSWPEAFELVAPLASDPDPEVRLALVTHVSQLGDPRGLDLIRVARTDEDARVRARAEDVLEWVDPQD